MNNNADAETRRMLQQFEHKVLEVNKRHIGEIAGEINEDNFLKLAEAISISRARYLKVVLQMANTEDGTLSDELLEDLHQQGEMYHEAMRGFNALRHALSRGYCLLTIG